MVDSNGGVGGFFVVDRRQWARACALDGINPACAYLVLCAFSDRSNTFTRASVSSAERYVGIGQANAARAIAALTAAGLVEPASTNRPARARPSYRIVKSDAAAGNDALPSDLWLPATIVTGMTEAAPSPLRILRETRNAALLRLFVDAYGAQKFVDGEGLTRDVWQEEYSARLVAHRGEYAFWSFSPESMVISGKSHVTQPHMRKLTDAEKAGGAVGDVAVWGLVRTLQSLHLIDTVTAVYDSAGPEGEVIYPCASTMRSLPYYEIGAAAKRLSDAALFRREANQEGGSVILPVPAHVGAPALRGNLLLRHAAATGPTVRWAKQAHAASAAWIARFDKSASLWRVAGGESKSG